MSARSIGPRRNGVRAVVDARRNSPPAHLRRNLLATMTLTIVGSVALTGCALTPDGTKQEQAKLEEAGRPYEPPFGQRVLPELTASPTWREVLSRAFLANGDLEAAYFEWKAAVQRVEMASAYPNSNVQVGYSYMFSSEKMKTFDRQTFSFGFDPSMNLSFPTKVQQKGKVALDEARAAGERFRTAKFDLQRRVLSQSIVQRNRVEVRRAADVGCGIHAGDRRGEWPQPPGRACGPIGHRDAEQRSGCADRECQEH